jgi:hypothetical protein
LLGDGCGDGCPPGDSRSLSDACPGWPSEQLRPSSRIQLMRSSIPTASGLFTKTAR